MAAERFRNARATRERCPANTRRARRRLVLWALPIAAILLIGAAKLVAQHLVAMLAVSQYDAGDYEAALNTAQLQKYGNVVETWKPYYNTGTSLLQLDALPQAEGELREALALAPPPEQCPVRSNLAITLERQGDQAAAAGDADGARRFYLDGRSALVSADVSCAQSPTQPTMNDTQERLEQKLEDQQQQNQGNGGDQQQDPQANPDTGELDRLQQDARENGQERQDAIDGEDDFRNRGGGPRTPVDRPW